MDDEFTLSFNIEANSPPLRGITRSVLTPFGLQSGPGSADREKPIRKGAKMKTQFTFKHLDHSEALQEYCRTRLEETSRFLLKDAPARVTFSKRLKEFCVEVTIMTQEKAFRAKSFHYDAYSSVDEAVEKLEKQILKVRKLLKNHKKPQLRKARQWVRKDEAA